MTKDKGQMNATSVFGLEVAEKVIFGDYVMMTHEVPPPSPGLNTIDWPDHGGKGAYCRMLSERNQNVSLSQLMKQPMQWPDIVTHNGLSGRLSLITGKIVPAAPGRYDRKEYYEIKPGSDGGRYRGRQKLRNIKSIYDQFALPYRPGSLYPALRQVWIPLTGDRAFGNFCRTLCAREGLAAVHVRLKVTRPQDGLLLYKVCVEFGYREEQTQKVNEAALAKHIMGTYLRCMVPDQVKQLLEELGDTSYKGDPIPRIKCRFDAIEALRPYQQAIDESLFQRGAAYPGDTFLIVCDEAAYRHLMPYYGPTVHSVWAKIRALAETSAELFAGRQGKTDLIQRVIVPVEEFARLAAELIPGLKEFADAVLRWIYENPGKSVAMVLVPVIITGGLAVAIEPALLAAEALIAEEALIATELTAGETIGAEMIGTLGRTALPQALVETSSGSAVASMTASRAVAMTFEEVALAQLGGAGAAANTTSNVVPLLTAMKAAAPHVMQKAGLAAAAGVAVMTFSAQAYADPSRSGTPGSAKGAGTLIAEHTSGIYMVPERAMPVGPSRGPVKDSLINIHDYGQTRQNSGSLRPAERLPPLKVRYLGKVTIS
ncbi:hypothetical protein [Kineosporia babensis]|uniref:Uncharacterized protein n=1 Tax=Kineosporia babensis TaxID=499548 RepID=A0A9X1ND67_9ACTN|nr:hypothetical protein [Kineosporia babensis]MCD5311091.1 hypothetical protein [Kineosporia babensis]